MTLGGLALAVGVLVDEATVVDREHPHAPRGGLVQGARRCSRPRRKTAVPRLLAMLCVLSVFIPSFFMAGVGAPAVRAAVAGRRLRDDLVVRAVEHARAGALHLDAASGTARRARRSSSRLRSCVSRSARVGRCAVRWLRCRRLPRRGGRADRDSVAADRHGDFPGGRSQAAPAAPARADRHAHRAHRADRAEGDGRDQEAGRAATTSRSPPGSSACRPPSYPINTIYLFTSGQHEAVLGVVAEARGAAGD